MVGHLADYSTASSHRGSIIQSLDVVLFQKSACPGWFSLTRSTIVCQVANAAKMANKSQQSRRHQPLLWTLVSLQLNGVSDH